MIIITGATGNLGSRIVDHLLERVPAETVGVSVRDESKAGGLAARGVRVRTGDFTRPDTLTRSFEGADQVLVVSAAIRGGGAFEANRAAIDAALAGGASRILYTSHQAASPDSFFPPQRVHAATEEHLAQQGVPFLALRNGFYANSLGIHLDSALATGQIAVPDDGPVSWTAHEDLAEAAAIALTSTDTMTGISPPLTASTTLDLADIAEILTHLTGRTITRVTMSDDEWKAAAIDRGLPPMVADFSLDMFHAARRGEFDVVNPTLETTLTHPPLAVEHTLEQLLREARP
ncbi:NmrA family transcriptional regulator [Arthrobacter sp. RIT-PI-e]|uniref:SDR family oxidoreductase n=1 Tax=Arthrobacter sp. RIT-PI-e TaxID=1681197 RepID=UPI000676872E|nr:SDR family oxidoreductase [Arthrobacter sp. RIT-PI-e]KNC19615.1 NmrA family transcriptional regulator [Arthrobacter sp. RIT-PI-e]